MYHCFKATGIRIEPSVEVIFYAEVLVMFDPN